jgi:hypothetical protein
VVLDLDLTLIHAVSVTYNPSIPNPDCSFIVSNDELKAMGYPLADDQRNVWVRPGLRKFLKEVSSFADVVIWTLSVSELAKVMIEKLDVDGCIKGVIGRHDCYFRGFSTPALNSKQQRNTFLDPHSALPASVHEGLSRMESHVNKPHFIKDLSALGYNMSRTVIVDDWPDLCILNPENAVIVKQFDHVVKPGQLPDDQLLSKALPLLRSMAPEHVDVRSVCRELGVKPTILNSCYAKARPAYESMLVAHRDHCRRVRPWCNEHFNTTSTGKFTAESENITLNTSFAAPTFESQGHCPVAPIHLQSEDMDVSEETVQVGA